MLALFHRLIYLSHLIQLDEVNENAENVNTNETMMIKFRFRFRSQISFHRNYNISFSSLILGGYKKMFIIFESTNSQCRACLRRSTLLTNEKLRLIEQSHQQQGYCQIRFRITVPVLSNKPYRSGGTSNRFDFMF